MRSPKEEIEFAIEVFVRGHSAVKSRTHPYEATRNGPLWVMRDAPRKNPRDYRKEEWIAHGTDAREVDAIARRHTRGWFFVCVMIREGEPDEPTRIAYKSLGYRLLATEGFFVQRLLRIPKSQTPVSIEWVRTPDRAAQFGKVTRTRPIARDLLKVAPFRQYVALDGEDIVGRAQRRCRGSDLVCGYVCQSLAPAPWHWPRAADQNVAGRSGAWFQLLGADGISHGSAPLPARGI